MVDVYSCLKKANIDFHDDPMIYHILYNGMDHTDFFFRTLYGCQDFGHLMLWTKQDKKSYPIQIQRKKYIVELVHKLGQKMDVYCGIGLQRNPPPPGQRGGSDTVSSFPGFVMDIDIQGPHHASKMLPDSLMTVMKFLRSLELKPSMIIETGGGVHAYWKFDKLYFIDTDEERRRIKEASRSFQQSIIREGQKYGWDLDNTSDLARLVRIPGTWNWKQIPPKPVYFLEPENGDIPFRDTYC